MKAKKSFGQHFLINEPLAESIVRLAIEKANQLPILEVGPGKAVLTKYLIEQNQDFKAVEADKDMVAYLNDAYENIDNRLIHLDFLKLDLESVFDKKPFLLMGNFPYNISSQIVFHALDHRAFIPVVIGMFQKEVADRIIAPHGSKTYGVTSVLTQVFYQGKTVFKVSPGSFNPPPKVNSSVLLLERNEILPKELSFSLFKSVVKNAFGQRRKMMRNTLKSLISDKSLLEDEIFSLRPEQISVNKFIELALMIQKQ